MTAAPDLAVARIPAGESSLAPRRRRRFTPGRVLLTVGAIVIALAFFVPALWIFIGSFRPNEELTNSMAPASWSLVIPSTLTVENYVSLIVDGGFGIAMLNSAIVCIAS